MGKWEKCSYGYLQSKKRWSLCKMLLGLTVILIVFVAGILVTKTRNNLATVAAILLALPVSRFAVDFFVIVPHKACDKNLYESVNNTVPDLNKNYDCVFSNSKKPIGAQAVVVTDHCICAYSEDSKVDTTLFETSLCDFLKNDKLNVSVSLYTDRKQFLDRIKKLQTNFDATSKENQDKMKWNSESMKNMCL